VQLPSTPAVFVTLSADASSRKLRNAQEYSVFRGDMYSVGVILYAVSYGMFPYGDSIAQVSLTPFQRHSNPISTPF
jgi:hypothetical protein